MNQKPPRKVITVDGLAASGKSTLSAMLARKLGFAHLNSGLIYRALAFIALKKGVGLDEVDSLEGLAKGSSIVLFRQTDGNCGVKIAGVDVTADLGTEEVAAATSVSSRHPGVRKALIQLQREAFSDSDLVAEGRDMGTVVFPNADLKFFVTAPLEMRVERRFKQLNPDKKLSDTEELRKKKIELELKERDARDSEREHSPTVAASDAVKIENATSLTNVLDNMYHAVVLRGLAD